MSNPSINRWGVSTFWHNFWYNDFNYAFILRQDDIFTKLIHIFLIHGINMTYNFFANNYWYLKHFSHLQFLPYQRWVTRKSDQTGKEIKFVIRKEVDAVFLMKLWILRYGNWLIINQYWFRPFKGKRRRRKGENPNHLDSFNFSNTPNRYDFVKMKTLLMQQLIKKVAIKSYYQF